MRTVVAALLAILVGASVARAEPAETCNAPGYLTFGDNLLERVTAAAKTGRLKIAVLGTTSSTLPGLDGARDAYPARLEATLRRFLPGVTVDVVSYAKPRQLAEKMVKTFDTVVKDERPNLVIWQTGTFDAMQGVDPKEFLNNVTDGVEKLKAAGVDAILVNMQYNPRTELMIATEAYAENMRWVARERQVPLFDRFAIMRNWNDTGVIDLYAATKDIAIAKRVHDCIGRALAAVIIDAGRLNAIEGKTPR
jgi:GDSL-like lipase/acylhydrolase family protein